VRILLSKRVLVIYGVNQEYQQILFWRFLQRIFFNFSIYWTDVQMPNHHSTLVRLNGFQVDLKLWKSYVNFATLKFIGLSYTYDHWVLPISVVGLILYIPWHSGSPDRILTRSNHFLIRPSPRGLQNTLYLMVDSMKNSVQIWKCLLKYL
jgi:hypothetical protein